VNHERSKKHREKAALLRSLLEEEDESAGKSCDTNSQSEDSIEEALDDLDMIEKPVSKENIPGQSSNQCDKTDDVTGEEIKKTGGKDGEDLQQTADEQIKHSALPNSGSGDDDVTAFDLLRFVTKFL